MRGSKNSHRNEKHPSGGTSLSQRGSTHTFVVVLGTSSEFIAQWKSLKVHCLSACQFNQLVTGSGLRFGFGSITNLQRKVRGRNILVSQALPCRDPTRKSARGAACETFLLLLAAWTFGQMIAFNMSHVGKGRTLSTPADLLSVSNAPLELLSWRGWDDSVCGLRLQLGRYVSLAFFGKRRTACGTRHRPLRLLAHIQKEDR